MRLAMASAVRIGAHWDKREIGDLRRSARRQRRQRRLAAVFGGLCDKKVIGPAWSKQEAGRRRSSRLLSKRTRERLGWRELVVKAEANDRRLTGGGAQPARGQLRRSARGETVSSSTG
jgi:hypothetical protein